MSMNMSSFPNGPNPTSTCADPFPPVKGYRYFGDDPYTNSVKAILAWGLISMFYFIAQ